MKEKYFLKNIRVIVFLSVSLCLVAIVITFIGARSYPFHKKINAQQGLICPSPAAAKSTLQMLNCYIPTATPTIEMPTPTQVTIHVVTDTLAPSPIPVVDPCASQLTTYASIKQALLSKYKIDLEGDVDINWANQAYVTMCKLYTSSTYSGLLTSKNTVVVTFHTGTCVRGYSDMNTGVDITGSCDPQLNRAILVHELGHQIAFRNPAIFNSFLNNIWPAQIPTYNCQIHYGDGPTAPECFADGVAEYVVYSYLRITLNGAPPGSTAFPEYPSTYAKYYNLMKDSIYGGVPFTSF